MAILDFAPPSAPVAAPNQRPSNNSRMPFGGMTNAADQPKAKLWLNIGYEVNGRFVNLPIGIPVDTMKPAEAKGQNEDWIKFQNARNQLLEGLQHFGMSLEPGAEVEVSTLVIKLRRVNEELDVTKADNEYAVDLAAMFAPPQKQVEPAE